MHEPDELLCLHRARLALLALLPERGPLLLLASGGSCLKLLTPELFARLPQGSAIAPLDERYSYDPEESNTVQIKKLLPSQSHVRLLGFEVQSDDSLPEVTVRLMETIDDWIAEHPGAPIIATLGIGKDGHTAGILPNSKATHSIDVSVVGYVAGDKYPGRVTMSFDFMRRRINHAICYAVGKDKAGALQLLEEPSLLANAPCRIMLEMADVQLFTDQP